MSKGEPFSSEEMDLFLNEADPGKTGKVVYKDFIKVLMKWLINLSTPKFSFQFINNSHESIKRPAIFVIYFPNFEIWGE